MQHILWRIIRFSLITPLQGERGRRDNIELALKEKKLRLGDALVSISASCSCEGTKSIFKVPLATSSRTKDSRQL
jgi:hypothetical protein